MESPSSWSASPLPSAPFPFAPNHGPAPFLDPTAGPAPSRPGEHGPWSLCPDGTRLKEFVIHAITLPIALNQKANIVDPVGQLFVLKEQEDAVRQDNRLKTPLTIRANASEDCVDVVFKSELPDSRANGFLSKANIHIHFAQFDVQASDGVNTGFNYEQSVRPFTVDGEPLTHAAAAGAPGVRVKSAERFHRGALVGVGMDQAKTFEIKRIRAVEATGLVFDELQLDFDADFNVDTLAFNDSGAASCTSRNGSGINPVGFTCTTRPVQGSNWQAQIATNVNTVAAFIAFAPGGPHPGFPLLGGEVLVQISPAPILLQGTGAFSVPIPLGAIWLGYPISTQGLRLDNVGPTTTFVLLNALDLVLGT